MSTYTVHLNGRDLIAEGTMAFHFQKPDGFQFKPGQAIDIILPHQGPPGDFPDGRHTFSIVTAPYEEGLTIATRMRDSPFKRTLGGLPLGTTMEIDGPFGSLTLHKNTARAAVLIAGGIGITPFMSMLRNTAKLEPERKLVLVYSNRRPEDTAFLPALQQLEKQAPGFRLLATMTDMTQSSQPWDGPATHIGIDLIKQAAQDLASPIFYISGPPSMVEAMRDTVVDAGMDEDDIRSEEFFGY